MRKLILAAGHSPIPGKDRGAIARTNNRDYIEGIETHRIVKDLYPILVRSGVDVYVDDYRNILSETIQSLRRLFGLGKFRSDTLAVDIHFNAGPPTATGCEVLCPIKPTKYELDVATDLASSISSALGVRNRGVKDESHSARKRLGWMRLPCENALVEICFLTNAADMDAYEKNYRRLIDALAVTLIDAVK